MAQTVVLKDLADRFPVGSTVGAYKASNWTSGDSQFGYSGAPKGSADATASVASDGSVTFTGLADTTSYVTTQTSGGTYAYVQFQSGPFRSSVLGGSTISTTDISPAARVTFEAAVNVKDPTYGAVGDGTTDDRGAFGSTTTAGSWLYDLRNGGRGFIPSGAYLWNSSGHAPLPQLSSTQGLHISGAGADVTEIKLTANALGAFSMPRVAADNETYQNILIEDLTVNANNVASATNYFVLLGNLIAGAWSQRPNFKNIVVRRCRTINVPAASTDGSSTGSRQSISICSRQPTAPTSTGDTTNGAATIANATGNWRTGLAISGTGIPAGAYVTKVSGSTLTISANATATNTGTALTGSMGEATQNTITDILVEDCDFGGGVGVFVGGTTGGASTPVNVFYDRLRFNRIKHDTGITPSASAAHATIQVGSTAYGGQVSIADCDSTGASDVSYELDQPQTATVERCRGTDPYNHSFLIRNIAASEDVNSQTIRFRNCVGRCVNLAQDVNNPKSVGWTLGGSGDTSVIGHVILDGCSYVSRAPGFNTDGSAFRMGSTRVRRTTIRDMTAVHDAVSVAVPASNINPNLFKIRPDPVTGTARVTIDGLLLKVAGSQASTGGGSLVPRLIDLAAGGTTATTIIDVKGVEVDYSVTGAASGVTSVINVGVNQGTVRGQISRAKILNWSGSETAPRLIEFQGTGLLTIDKRIDVTECDISSGPASTVLTLFQATSNRASVYERSNIYRTFPPARTTDNSKFNSGTFTTATGNQYLGGYPALVSLSGGVAVTAADISVDNSTYVNVLTQASGAVTNPTNFYINHGDYLKLTFTTTAPTVSVTPLR
jgi:hypothetical protein